MTKLVKKKKKNKKNIVKRNKHDKERNDGSRNYNLSMTVIVILSRTFNITIATKNKFERFCFCVWLYKYLRKLTGVLRTSRYHRYNVYLVVKYQSVEKSTIFVTNFINTAADNQNICLFELNTLKSRFPGNR